VFGGGTRNSEMKKMQEIHCDKQYTALVEHNSQLSKWGGATRGFCGTKAPESADVVVKDF